MHIDASHMSFHMSVQRFTQLSVRSPKRGYQRIEIVNTPPEDSLSHLAIFLPARTKPAQGLVKH